MLNKSLSSYLQLGNNQWKIIVAFCSLPSYLSSGFYFWIVKLSPWVHLAYAKKFTSISFWKCKLSLEPFISVPDAPPQTVTGHNVSQTEIKLLWRPVPLDNLNGILMGYKGSCRIAKGNQPSTEKQFNSSVFEGVLDGLNAFTTYACSVRAFTIKGDGPPSSDLLVKTEEEGKGNRHHLITDDL